MKFDHRSGFVPGVHNNPTFHKPHSSSNFNPFCLSHPLTLSILLARAVAASHRLPLPPSPPITTSTLQCRLHYKEPRPAIQISSASVPAPRSHVLSRRRAAVRANVDVRAQGAGVGGVGVGAGLNWVVGFGGFSCLSVEFFVSFCNGLSLFGFEVPVLSLCIPLKM
jgi:hypothetical protein